MSEEERIWADTLADAVEPANEYEIGRAHV